MDILRFLPDRGKWSLRLSFTGSLGHHQLRRQHFWARGYWVSRWKNEEAIRRYIRERRRRTNGVDELELAAL